MNNMNIFDNTIICLHFSTDRAAINEPCDAIVLYPLVMSHGPKKHTGTSNDR